jgi:hypothetical protein
VALARRLTSNLARTDAAGADVLRRRQMARVSMRITPRSFAARSSLYAVAGNFPDRARLM